MEEKFTIHKAQSEDAEETMLILRKTWMDTYVRKNDVEKYNITYDDLNNWYESNWQERIEEVRNNIAAKDETRLSINIKDEFGKIIGILSAHRLDNNAGKIGSIYVDPDYQGQKLGKMLMTEALNWLGLETRVSLSVAAYNQKAIEFYKKFGFEITKELPETNRILHDKVIPEVEMMREIQNAEFKMQNSEEEGDNRNIP